MNTSLFSVVILVLFAATTEAAAPPGELASRLWARLTGTLLALDDPRRPQMEKLLAEGQANEAAKIATADDGFINVTVRHWAGPFGNRAETPTQALDDTTAMILGTVRDDRDFREILTGDFIYFVDTASQESSSVPTMDSGSNQHFESAEREGVNLRRTLKRREPQEPRVLEAAGVLTSRAWAEAHLQAGTNRRAIDFTFRQFLCSSLQDMRDATLPDFRVHRDVDRSPGGNSQTYLNTCRSCHAGMDALVSAYAYFRFDFRNVGQGVIRDLKVQRKMNQNGSVYPEGYITADDSWINLFTQNQNARFGWRGDLSGNGIRQFGNMIANSEGFSRCMTRKVFRQVCNRELQDSEESLAVKLASDFEKQGYRLRTLFEGTAVVPQCL